jgi:glutaminyl-tRNA synthetase
MNAESTDEKKPLDFIRQRVKEDLDAGLFPEGVITRFPPEPNGYLHVGHAKAICINYGIAEEFDGRYHLRFDDTNPEAEETEYVESIQEDIRWLGFDWGKHLYFASDYFQQMYDYAVQLIRDDKAYVCDLTPEQFKVYRGVPTEPGRASPNRDRPIEENLGLFEEMKAGKHADGSLVLRAKIDMSSPNLHLRDPAMYRIKTAHHHRTGDAWCLYPMYDWAHGLEDSIEGITHSLCSLEFEVHRPLYDWFLDQLPVHHPQQIEFARLNLGYTMMSKRKLLQLVRDGDVDGWDDPRMPTLSGLRRRGCPPEAIRAFCDEVGITKYESLTDVALLEYAMRTALNRTAERRMAVLNPLKLIITNYPENEEESFEAVNLPEDPGLGTRQVPFSRELYIERDDFMEDPPQKFFRLGPGREVRLRAACYVTCTDVIKDEAGKVIEVHGTFDPESRGGSTPDKRKVKGTMHWVSAKHAVEAEVRLYDRLFNAEKPDGDRDGDFKGHLNPDSLQIVRGYLEPSLAAAGAGDRFQFERVGYFSADKSHRPEAPVFNRTVTLRDSWAKKK